MTVFSVKRPEIIGIHEYAERFSWRWNGQTGLLLITAIDADT